MLSDKLLALNLVTYNSAATLLTCIAALDRQTFRAFSISVFDNASIDGTLDWLKSRPDITLSANTTNIGYAAAHNRLIDQTTSEYVLTLNPDVALDPGYLAAIVAALDADPQTGSAAGGLLRVEHLDEIPTQIDSVGLFMRRNRRDVSQEVRQPRFDPLSPARVIGVDPSHPAVQFVHPLTDHRPRPAQFPFRLALPAPP